MTSEPQPASSSLRRSKAGGALHWFGALLIFLAEMLMLLGLAWWGFTAVDGWARVLIGLALPAVVATVWGLALAPRARFRWRDLTRLPVRTLVLAAGALALFAVGASVLAWVDAVLIVVGTVLTASFPAPPSVTGDVTPDA